MNVNGQIFIKNRHPIKDLRGIATEIASSFIRQLLTDVEQPMREMWTKGSGQLYSCPEFGDYPIVVPDCAFLEIYQKKDKNYPK
ncbi:hypothetical protein T4E_213 [Trichinella pseudospiralis]|uniref:Uncharacterized protein n=1 Tax=Trichinella pseudospiralis TaxID=6337 RepID=A0A0V0YKP3_TRIPS|nr:hypothetical protein T4E_213 [Trichinella pseudospiralis]